MKVKVKLTMVYESRSLQATENLLAQLKDIVGPKEFNATVRIIEPKQEQSRA